MASFFENRSVWIIQQIFSLPSIVVILLAWISYLICLGVYRVYFSSLAKFPGPKLAALTTWYQGYYDIWLGGQYIWRIEEMHAQYDLEGPVVRINPHEIHINDPEYIDDIYSGSSKKRDKYRWIGRMFSNPGSMAATIPHDLHRKRRAALNPYFSKASVRRLEPVIQSILTKFLGRMDSCRRSGEIMPIGVAYKATTSDIITSYAFGNSTNYLEREDYYCSFFDAVETFFASSHLMLQLGWLGPLLKALPIAVVARFIPGMAFLFNLQQQLVAQIEEIRDTKDPKTGMNTIFYGLLNSDLPTTEKSTLRLCEEAQAIVVAGLHTTATTLSAITYHLLANPDKLKRLREELAVAIPNPNELPSCAQTEHLPYLSAVIQEGIRLHPGGTLRMQRVSPDEPLYYDDGRMSKWTIPAGTPVSMTPTLIQMNLDCFPEPREFRPERWLDNPRLDRYMLAFSKGTRVCLGINLAYLELTLILAGIFRRYDVYDETGKLGPSLALYETTREKDVDMVADMAIPYPAPGSKGVRVLVRFDECHEASEVFTVIARQSHIIEYLKTANETSS